MSVFSISRHHGFSSNFSTLEVSWPPRELDQKRIERSTGGVVEQGFMSLPMYIDTYMFIEKYIEITWQYINTIFVGSFKENLEDCQVYVNIHKSGLYKVAYRHPTILCADVIHWIVSQIDPEMFILSNASGVELAS